MSSKQNSYQRIEVSELAGNQEVDDNGRIARTLDRLVPGRYVLKTRNETYRFPEIRGCGASLWIAEIDGLIPVERSAQRGAET